MTIVPPTITFSTIDLAAAREEGARQARLPVARAGLENQPRLEARSPAVRSADQFAGVARQI